MTVPRSLIGAFVVVLSLGLTGCIGAMQTTAHEPVGVSGLKPTQEDRDAAIDRFAVADPEVKDEEDKKLVATMPVLLQSELVRQLRATGLFGKVVNLSETEFKPGSERARGDALR